MLQMMAAMRTDIAYGTASDTGGEKRWQKTKTHPVTTSREQGA